MVFFIFVELKFRVLRWNPYITWGFCFVKQKKKVFSLWKTVIYPHSLLLTPVLSTILWLTFSEILKSNLIYKSSWVASQRQSKTLPRKIDGPISLIFLIHSSPSSSLFLFLFFRVLLIQVRGQTFPKVIPEVQPVHPASGKCLWSSHCGVWSVHIPTCQSGTNTNWYYSKLS